MKTHTELMALGDNYAKNYGSREYDLRAALSSALDEWKAEIERLKQQVAANAKLFLEDMAAVEAERDALKLAVEAFIKYDSSDSDEGVQMMIDYDDALTKAKAAMNPIKPFTKEEIDASIAKGEEMAAFFDAAMKGAL